MIIKPRLFKLALALGMSFFASPLFAVMMAVSNGEEGPGQLFSVDLTTGAGTFIASLPDSMTEAAYDADNNRFYAQSSDGGFVLYEIDVSDGSEISSVGTTGAYNGMEFVNGTLYAAMITCSSCASDLVTVDPATGAATVIGPTGYGPITGLAYYAGTMYGVVGGSDAAAGSLVTVDMSTGVAAMVGPTGFGKIGSIEFGSDGFLYGGLTRNDNSNPYALIRIDTATGVGTLVGDSGISITGLAEMSAPPPPPPPAAAPAVPVPAFSDWALIMLVLLLGAATLSRLRSHAKR